MNRSKFLQKSSFLTLGFTFLRSKQQPSDDMRQGSGGTEPDFSIEELTIEDLQTQMASGSLTAVGLTRLYFERIEQIDKSGPRLNSVIEVNPDALSIAAERDLERKNGKLRGPLHGIPVLIKDNINSGDRMMTTAGSLALEGHRASEDAFIVKRLREAGAVLLGKTNLSEWANYRSTRSSSGWSSRGGQTRNPFSLSRTPSGSSAGSGAAVSANLCALAIGSETDGSIVSPSSVSGIVGIKPTVGLLSRSGIIPISASQDTAGPMARTVWDAAILLGALTGTDKGDEASLRAAGKASKDYTKALELKALEGKRIGIEKSLQKGNNEQVDALFAAAIKLMKEKGAEFVEVDLLKEINKVGQHEGTVLSYEFKDGINKYLAAAGWRLKTLKDLIAFNSANADKVMPFFGQELFLSAQARGDVSSKDYLDAKRMLQQTSRKAIDDLLEKNKLQAICAPTSGLAWLTDQINGDYDTGYGFSTPAAVAGYPHITVPMGRVHSLPAGLSFMGTAWSEQQLISLAYAYEQASHHRVKPAFLPDSN